MGTLKSEDGGWCCLLLKLPFFPRKALYCCLSSIIIFHNSLIDFYATTEGGGATDLEQNVSAQILLTFSHLDFRQSPFIVHKAQLFFFTGSILDLNISVMTTAYSLFIPTIKGGFCQFPSKLKGSIIHLKWCGDLLYRLHWSQLSKRAALCEDSDPPDLPSPLLHWKP